MNIKQWIKLILLVVLLPVHAIKAQTKDNIMTLKICVDIGDWRPFVYMDDGKITGDHIETVKKVLDQIGIAFEFIPAPWKRCLKGAEKGAFDAIATASYSEERERYMFYPEDASNLKSEFRVGQVQYNIIVHEISDFEYLDELVFIPRPTRVPRDYSIGKDLRAMGFIVDDSSINDQQNLKRLVREKTGSVVALPHLVKWANQQEELKGQIKLIEKPIKSKSYFLAFSKLGQVDEKHADFIWRKIRRVRDGGQFNDYLPQPTIDD